MHGVVCPSDVTWKSMDAIETMKLYTWCFIERKYTGKFFGSEFDEFMTNQQDEFPILSNLVREYKPSLGEPGIGFSDACLECYNTNSISDTTVAKSTFSKVFCDFLAEKCGYSHNKGLLLFVTNRHG